MEDTFAPCTTNINIHRDSFTSEKCNSTPKGKFTQEEYLRNKRIIVLKEECKEVFNKLKYRISENLSTPGFSMRVEAEHIYVTEKLSEILVSANIVLKSTHYNVTSDPSIVFYYEFENEVDIYVEVFFFEEENEIEMVILMNDDLNNKTIKNSGDVETMLNEIRAFLLD